MSNGEKLRSNPEENNTELSREVVQPRGEITLQAANPELMTTEELLALREKTAREVAELEARLAGDKAKDEIETAAKGEIEAAAAEPEVVASEIEAPVEPEITGAEPEVVDAEPESADDALELAPVSPEVAAATAEKAKNSATFKDRLRRIALVALPITLAAAIAIGVGVRDHNNNKDTAPAPTPTIEQTVTIGEVHEARGIYDGYGEKGMWLSEHKSGPLNFACATEVAEVCNHDEKEMVKYTADNQVESFADYLSGLPRALQPAGFEGLTLKETEAKLESLSNEDYDALKEEFDGIIDSATVSQTILNGRYQNAYMRQIDKNGDVVHDNMELVGCHTTENNYEATMFSWYDEDGNFLGSMTVKDKTCMQVVEKEGDSDRLKDLDEVGDEDPGDEDSGDEDPGDEDPDDGDPDNGDPDDGDPDNGDPDDGEPDNNTPDWGKKGDPHGGPDVKPSVLVDPDSEVTEKENDDTNKDNQGYVDDHQAAPGSPSENNGTDNRGFSPITAPGATTEDTRLPGGKNQGTSAMAGENAHIDQSTIDANREVDQTGNKAQAEAQKEATPGQKNHTDEELEKIVNDENGDY